MEEHEGDFGRYGRDPLTGLWLNGTTFPFDGETVMRMPPSSNRRCAYCKSHRSAADPDEDVYYYPGTCCECKFWFHQSCVPYSNNCIQCPACKRWLAKNDNDKVVLLSYESTVHAYGKTHADAKFAKTTEKQVLGRWFLTGAVLTGSLFFAGRPTTNILAGGSMLGTLFFGWLYQACAMYEWYDPVEFR